MRQKSINEEPPTWQQVQRHDNRQKILSTARDVFVRKSYSLTVVDDISSSAGISRTSFYKHFSDKLEVVQVLVHEFEPILLDAYGSIANIDSTNQVAIKNWLRYLTSFYAENARLMAVFGQARITEQEFGGTVSHLQRRIMQRLGIHLMAFRAAGDSAEGSVDWTKASLLLGTIDYFCSSIEIHNVQLDPETGIKLLAEQVLAFTSGSGQ